ncbi:hypothetical protein O1L55_13700 [Streptomyces albulus]|nr:hypothetical protein [Streptomyces noursei]
MTDGALQRLAAAGRLVQGEFHPRDRSGVVRRPGAAPAAPPFAGRAARGVGAGAARRAGRLPPQWQHVGAPRPAPSSGAPAPPATGSSGLRGLDGLVRAVEQLQGAPVPASALEKLVLPSRVGGYAPALLDELTATGEVLWAGAGALPGKDGWLSLHLADTAPLLLRPRCPWNCPRCTSRCCAPSPPATACSSGRSPTRSGPPHIRTPPIRSSPTPCGSWPGRVGSPTTPSPRCAPCSARAARRAPRPTAPAAPSPGRYGTLTAAARPTASRSGPPTVGGRWSLLPAPEPDPTHRAHALARTLLDRHGIVTRGAVAAEGSPGLLRRLPRAVRLRGVGQARRGYVVEGLGAAQFAMDGAVDRLRAISTQRERGTDGPFPDGGPAQRGRGGGGRAPWSSPRPTRPTRTAPRCPGRSRPRAPPTSRAARRAPGRPGRRRADALPGARRQDAPDVATGRRPGPGRRPRLHSAVEALVDGARAGAVGTLTTERINGTSALTSPTRPSWRPRASTHARGMRLRG